MKKAKDDKLFIFKIPKSRQKSFDVALDEAQDAFKGYSTNEDRCNKLQFDYSGKTKRKSLDSIDRPKAKPKNNHRRKSILPPRNFSHYNYLPLNIKLICLRQF